MMMFKTVQQIIDAAMENTKMRLSNQKIKEKSNGQFKYEKRMKNRQKLKNKR
jgi:hypothetical protein